MSSDTPWQEVLQPLVLPLQVMVGALVGGCVMFLVVVLAVSGGAKPASEMSVITYAAIGLTVVALLARTIVPSVIVSQARRRMALGLEPTILPLLALMEPTHRERLQRAGDAGRLWRVYFKSLMLSAAILEGATFFLLVAFLLEHSLPALVLAAAMIFTLALHLPTRNRIMRWIEEQLMLVEQQRQLGR